MHDRKQIARKRLNKKIIIAFKDFKFKDICYLSGNRLIGC